MTVDSSAPQQRTKIVFAGTPLPAAIALRGLLEDPRLDVVAVITQPDAKRGRGRSLHPSAVAEVAAEANIPTHKWETLAAGSPAGEVAREALREYAKNGVQSAAVVAYGNLIPADLLDVFPDGWINLHYSLLPRWRGAAPVQAALAAGDAVTGASTFRIEAGMDTGPVIATWQTEISDDDTAETLLISLTQHGTALLGDSLVALHEGTATLTPQDDSSATHAPKIQVEDARIRWDQPRAVIHHIARAHTPAPGAWSAIDDKRFKIGAFAAPARTNTDAVPMLAPGELHWTGQQVFVGTGDDPLEIVQLQPPGKKMMLAADWARGQQQLFASNPRFH